MKFNIQTLTFLTTLFVVSTQAMHSDKKHIMVPLEGFLFKVDTSAGLGEMGVSGALSAAWAGGISGLWRTASSKGADQTALAARLFTLLEKVNEPSEASSFNQSPCTSEVYWRGIKAPAVIVSWLKSAKPCLQIREAIMPVLKKEAGIGQGTSLQTLANIIFDPEKNASMLVPNDEAIKFILALQAKGHTVHIVDNWNTEAFEQLQKRYPETFKNINGFTHISGRTSSVKSANHCALQDTFFKAHPEVLAACSLFIETEEQHTKPLAYRSFKHIMCASSDIKKLQETEAITVLLE